MLYARYLDDINGCIYDAIGELKEKRILELGNQIIPGNEGIPEKTGKEYYTNRGVQHISVDLNGMDGAVKVDLSKPIKRSEWLGYFDVVTNVGTIEHVEPYKGQYQCFMNVHNCLKVGGVAIHFLPDNSEVEKWGWWKGHCNYFYSQEFIEMLAMENNYRVISSKIIDGQIFCCLQKKKNTPFMENKKGFFKYIIKSKYGIIYPGIKSRFITWLLCSTRPIRLRFGLTKYQILRKLENGK